VVQLVLYLQLGGSKGFQWPVILEPAGLKHLVLFRVLEGAGLSLAPSPTHTFFSFYLFCWGGCGKSYYSTLFFFSCGAGDGTHSLCM
jgi:hypothetical protein